MLTPYDFSVNTGLRRSLLSLGGAPFVWQEEVASIFPIFLHWLPKHRLSIPSKRSLEIWRLVIDNLTIDDMNLNPWAGCKGYVECKWALELNGSQVLFECGHGKYWYLGDRVLPQVEHVHPSTTIPTPPCHVVRLVDLLADEEIAQARDGYIVAGVEGNYSKFVYDLQPGCLVDRTPPTSKGGEGGEEEEEIPSPHHAGISSSSFLETYPHFPAWQFDVMNPDGTYSSMPLTGPEHVDGDLVEESMQMIGGLQSLARTQSSQYVLNDSNWSGCHTAHEECHSALLECRSAILECRIELGHALMPTPLWADSSRLPNAHFVDARALSVVNQIKDGDTEYSNWLVNKIVNKEDEMVAMRKKIPQRQLGKT
ncbi:hypothetical protein SO802_022077 [Lithocarpus litseifolius]|uniref:Uncharacterized protein n=1 Tax=Lithocarpus litseifolius TaxID=425828 RepID=A0AAW2CHX1_9ROSI